MTATATTDSFPRQYARTQRFTLGEPRTFSVSPDGARVIFLRSRSGSDAVNCLWEFDLGARRERLVVDPLALMAESDTGILSDEERARRERLREAGGGITAYTVSDDVTRFAFSLSGQLFVGDFASAAVRPIATVGPAFDPRLDPSGSHLAYVVDGELFCVRLDSPEPSERLIAGRSLFGEDDAVSWGVADFIAAEEMGRYRGFWWSPDGRHLAVTRVDESHVSSWTIADPSQPSLPARTVRYPAAGSTNALVTLSLFALDDAERRDVEWDITEFPYLAGVTWGSGETFGHSVYLSVQSRDQRSVAVGRASWETPRLERVHLDVSDSWVDLVPGSPALLSDGTILTVANHSGVKRIIADGHPITPKTLDVYQIVSASGTTVVFAAIDPNRPESWTIHSWDSVSATVRRISPDAGIHSAAVGGSTIVLRSASVKQSRPTVSVIAMGEPEETVAAIDNLSETPLVEPNVRFLRVGTRRIPCALVLPRDIPAGTRLPILMDPYGGPHAQRVVDSFAAHCSSQWFADQGFAVIVADGRGTPGLGTEWERSVRHDLATAVLEDQIDALQTLADEHEFLDASRVAIRGWSFGGYLAALAVLRRPDVFHAAVAGAPVTDWRLYDTHYTERYLGDPNADDEPYRRTSLLEMADRLARPLLLIHGLADDNVVAAHTLQLSAALLAAGKPHEVLPLSGVTHMTPQAVVAENLLLHQLDFIRRSLDVR
jgi:dipeptidyl-peptidase-4